MTLRAEIVGLMGAKVFFETPRTVETRTNAADTPTRKNVSGFV